VNTILLSDEQVAAYLRDLLERLSALGEAYPRVWCPIGPSGGRVAQAAMREVGRSASDIQHVPVAFERATGVVSFPRDPHPEDTVKGKNVLLIDGAIHSGNTFAKVYRAVEALGVAEICSYSLVVRRGATALPSFFGLAIGDHDRALFLKRRFPNNRLSNFGWVRKLAEEDDTRPMIKCGEDFIDKFSWGDLLYEMRVDQRRRTYLYERNGDVQGFVSFRLTPGETILVDTLGVDRTFQRQGVAGHLMRWAETCGRNAHCGAIELWGVDGRKEWYEKRGYGACGEALVLDGTRFHLMRKKLLYNLPDDGVLTTGL